MGATHARKATNTPRQQLEGAQPKQGHEVPDDFETLLAALRNAYHRDLAEATDDSELREQLRKAETVVEQLAKLARSLVSEEIRESQYINRSLRLVGYVNE